MILKTNQAKSTLDFYIGKLLETLESEAETFQAQGVADDRIGKYQKELKLIEEQIITNTHRSDFETYARLNEMLRDLRRQKTKTSGENRITADSIIKTAEKLQRQLAKEVDNPAPEAKRRKRAARNEEIVKRPDVPTVQPPPPAPPKTIPDVLKDAGWLLKASWRYLHSSYRKVLLMS
ncbi:MAG: hypothetical protein IPO81_08750 [Kouleothrix sp.]|nr:hypothetical protein [Kouleothrix sp.]